MIILDMHFGRAHFKEFMESPEGIETNILSDRPAKLVQWGLAERYPSDESPGRDAYRLTSKGLSLSPVLKAIADWCLAEIKGTAKLLKAKPR